MAVSLGIPSVRAHSHEQLARQLTEQLAERAPEAPRSGPLADAFGRIANDLRISLTDKCNLRCSYCMPAEGMEWMPQESLLTAEEVSRLVDIAVGCLSVRELRLTGGEPLIRPDLEDIIAAVRTRHPRLPISLTTNAIGLERRAPRLAAAGLERINISLDTVDPKTFATMTRRARFDHVMRGIAAAKQAGLQPIKLNAVLMRGVNDDEAPELVRFALEHGYQLRFIEQMPLDGEHGWTQEGMVSAAEVRALLARHWSLSPAKEPRGSAPAEVFRLACPQTGDEVGTVGIIASVTEPFCAACSRTRITAEGKVRSCLFSHEEFDLAALLRSGAGDEEIAQVWRQAMWLKPKAHGMDQTGLDSADFVQPDRSMSAIGG